MGLSKTEIGNKTEIERFFLELGINMDETIISYRRAILEQMNSKWENKRNRPSINFKKIEDRLFSILENMEKIGKLHVDYFQNITNFTVYCDNKKYKKEVELVHEVFSKDFLSRGFELLIDKDENNYFENKEKEEQQIVFRFLLVLMNSVPFVLLKKKSFKLSFLERNYLGVPQKIVKEFKIQDIVRKDFLKNMLEDILKELVEKEDKGIKNDYMEWLGVSVLLSKIYKDLDNQTKEYIMNFMPTFISIDNSSLIKLSPFTLDNEFWKDFMDYKVDNKISNKEKILNSRDFPLFRKWFVDFWKDQKEIPGAVEEVLKEINKQNKVKKKKLQEAKDLEQGLSNTSKIVQKIIEPSAVEEKEKESIPAPAVEKVNPKDRACFLYEIPRKNAFVVQFKPKNTQNEKFDWTSVSDEKIDLLEYANNSNRTIYFRYFKEGEFNFEIKKISLNKKPRKKPEDNKNSGLTDKEKGNPANLVGDVLVLPNDNPPVVETAEEGLVREQEQLKKDFSDALEMYKDNKEEIFAGISEKIKNDSFSFKFSRDFIEMIGQENVEISVNIVEKTSEFKNLQADDRSREILEKYVWELLEEKIVDWENMQKELDATLAEIEQKQQARAESKRLAEKQKEVNDWLLNFNQIIHSEEFFQNSENFSELLEYVETKNGRTLIASEMLKNFMLVVSGKGYKEESKKILDKLIPAGIKSQINLKNRKINISGEITVSENRKHEFESYWDKEKNRVVLTIKGEISQNSKRKIQAIFRKVFLKIFWEVLDKSKLNTVFLGEFESYLEEERYKKLAKLMLGEKDKSTGDKLRKKLQAKKRWLHEKIEKGEYLGIDEDGNVLKKERMKELGLNIFDENSEVKSLILRQDNVRSVDDSHDSEQKMKFHENSYIKLREFIENGLKNEKYLIKRFQITIDNYLKYEEAFEKYDVRGKSPFKNKAIIDLLLDEILPLFGFTGQRRSDFLKTSPTEIAALVFNKKDSLVDLFLKKAQEAEIPLAYVSDFRIKVEYLKKFLEI